MMMIGFLIVVVIFLRDFFEFKMDFKKNLEDIDFLLFFRGFYNIGFDF
jgi:hypothetical protein